MVPMRAVSSYLNSIEDVAVESSSGKWWSGNLNNFIASGFNNILGQPDGKLHRIMTKLAFEMKGDAWEPFTYGQKAWAFHTVSYTHLRAHET